MVSDPFNTWLDDPQRIQEALSETTQLLNEAYDPVSVADLYRLFEDLDRPHVMVYQEFSRTVISDGTRTLRLAFKGALLSRVDLLKAPLKTSRIAIQYGYDGTLYKGSQIQPNVPTITGQIESILGHLFQSDITLHPASRTDAGVHAKAATAHFDAPFNMAADKLLRLMNRMAPSDLVIHHVQEVTPFFHARYDLLTKTYAYTLSRIKRVETMHKVSVFEPLDIVQFTANIQAFEGTHDFRNFAKVDASTNTVRTIESIDIHAIDDDTYRVTFHASGFLRHMIRMIIGAALEYSLDAIQNALAHPETPSQKVLAPAEGLMLVSTDY